MDKLIPTPSALQKHGYRLGPLTTTLSTAPKTTAIVALKLHKTASDMLSLGAIDVQTGKVLLDEIYDAEIPGTCCVDLNRCVEQARRDIYKYVNADTILVVYGGQDELKLLEIVHGRIIDLKVLGVGCVEILGRDKLVDQARAMGDIVNGLLQS
ncbi:uncharacterized protein DSM5745_00098 [Aspergillus mulundensis]|uniref:Uncharacterized protein n=1 Tax=Aspergillus mulundensis TaxID=1810919 RepID=A0A3D8T2I7_9EURO|nr:hypothetical protein DSM5745_00098 [Aspergillus mulundensis]RDW92776.1 hypothetical protein DSM5745_00098 [Aspergillus mulundensis]